MAMYTEKTLEEAISPLLNYSGDSTFVKGQAYALQNGGDPFDYSRNLKGYNKALEDSKANDNDSFWSKLGDMFVGRDTNKLRADVADQYAEGFAANPYEFDTDSYKGDISQAKSEYDPNKGTYMNGGLLGALVNPITQVGKAGVDLGSGVSSGNWDAWNKRDHLSDIGALGETALMFVAPGAGGAGASLGKAVGKNALLGAGFGASGGLREMGSKDFDLGNLATSTALGAGIGGAIGGATHGMSKVWNKYSQPAPSKSTDIMPYAGGANTNSPQLQEYMRTLGVTGDNMTEAGLRSARKQATQNIAKNVGFETAEGQTQRAAVNNAYQALLNNLNGGGASATAYTAPTLSFGQKLSNFGSNIPQMGRDIAGTKVGKLLKTKKGKVMAGAGGGLLLAQLMRNGNSGNDEMSEADMQELYNYVYGGGQ